MKKLFTCVLTLGIASTVTLAQASDLVIVNRTKQDSTSVIHTLFGNACSADVLKEKGVTRAGTTNTIPAGSLKMACTGRTENCQADVFMTANCSGPKIAEAHLSLTRGIVSFELTPEGKARGYNVSATGFRIEASGGPQ